MKVSKLNFNDIPHLSKTDKAYINSDTALRAFYKYDTSLEKFADVINNKNFSDKKRLSLYNELIKQYDEIDADDATINNIEKLKNRNCFTVVTAHQPCLFTGPLYFIYKIISTINLAEQLSAHYPEYQFVPIFWTGGEDHDFEEVNHLRLFGKKIVWDDFQGGPVGQYNIDSLRPVLDEVKQILGKGQHAEVLAEKLELFFTDTENYSLSVRKLINWIFKEYGLVIVNGNSYAFKKQMIPLFKDDLLHHSSKHIVEKTSAQLKSLGFKKQAHPRDINLFYLSPNNRGRIVREGDSFLVSGTSIRFSESEILDELNTKPQNFSPNVILRPLFQESVLPNLAYIGGGGELAYWLERMSQFNYYMIPFPMLIRRCSVLWVDKNASKKMDKLAVKPLSLFDNIDKIIKEFLLSDSSEDLSLKDEILKLNKIYEGILHKSSKVDPALNHAVLAQQTQMQKAVEKLEQKLFRAEKKKNETTLLQIRKLKEKLFPENGLQERKDNFLDFYCRYGSAFLEVLKDNLQPLDKKIVVIVD